MATLRICLISASVAAVVAAVVGVGAAFVTVRCLPVLAGQSTNGAIQEGTTEVRWGEEVEVFYKPPFANPPDLKFPEGLENNCHVSDRKAASFKLRRDVGGSPGPQYPAVKWRAEGQPGASGAPAG